MDFEEAKKRINQFLDDINQEKVRYSFENFSSEFSNFTNEIKKKYFSRRHVLVIGGGGYVGSVLVKNLLNRGYKVRVLDSLIYGHGASLHSVFNHKNFSFVKGNFGVEEVLKSSLNGITDVVLLAALVGDPICKKYQKLTKKVNVEFPKKLFEMLNRRGIQRFIFTSTCSNYGLRQDDTPADETATLNPQSLYAETKVLFEQHILRHVGQVDYSPVILRLSTAFGMSNRMRFDLTISEFSRELALGNSLLVYDENTWRPYCHVEDISVAIIKSLEYSKNKVHGEVFNVGSNEENYTKKMIVDVIQQILPNSEVEYKEGGFDPRNYRVSFDKINLKLNFHADFTVSNSVRLLTEGVRNNLFSDLEKRKNFYGNYSIDESRLN